MATDKPVLLCCDLDRTLIPNGPQPESPQAREKFRQLIERPEVKLAYVSGRDKQLLLSAIADYDLPVPDYAIGDVGTSLYHIRANEWRLSGDWHQHISQDWHGLQQPDLQEYLHTFPQLELQETEKQNRYKLSYYVDPKVDISTLLTVIDQTLQANNIRANLVWSIDEQQNTGLLDILPASANKLHAINYLIAHEGFQTERTIFAGDSGNDLDVLTSPLQAVLVNNAMPEIKQQALESARLHHTEQQLYIAVGDFMGMNGNYAAGILEGVAHYLPEYRK